MKKLIKSDNNVRSTKGTTFYRMTIDQIKDAFKDSYNIWISKTFDELGLDAINFDMLYGSAQDYNGLMYYCDSDGYEIDIDGEMVDPEEALNSYDPEDELAPYTKQATSEIILKNITVHEIQTPSFDKWAEDLMRDGYSFTSLIKAKDEFWPES